MQHSFGVRGGEAGAQLARDLDRLVAGQAPDAPQQAAQILAIHVLHGNVGGAVHFADVVHAADVGMRDLARDPDLAVEAFEQPGIVGGGFREKLQGDGLVELEVDGAIDLAHAASAHQTENAVAVGQDRTGGEAPFLGSARRRRRLGSRLRDGEGSSVAVAGNRRSALRTEAAGDGKSGFTGRAAHLK